LLSLLHLRWSSQCDVEAVGQERNEYVRLDTLLELVEDRTDGKIAFEVLEGLFHCDKL
jgi:hypothetical protein